MYAMENRRGSKLHAPEIDVIINTLCTQDAEVNPDLCDMRQMFGNSPVAIWYAAIETRENLPQWFEINLMRFVADTGKRPKTVYFQLSTGGIISSELVSYIDEVTQRYGGRRMQRVFGCDRIDKFSAETCQFTMLVA